MLQVLGEVDGRHPAAAKFTLDGVAVGKSRNESIGRGRHRFRRCEFAGRSARCAEFGVPFGAPNGEQSLERAADENAKLLKRKRLAEYAAGESNREPTD